ncbi:hypothetical protein MiSe_91910 [Microseira wollei NIES-4236]|uniref:Uncharacterized protein n=2 Tax=Microseira wollei TaxID=467598 RepID=A0AAV3WQ98_9CYAN|nr:hypothetical protein MiSe_91910 [Microseira wollei NIES-4236]
MRKYHVPFWRAAALVRESPTLITVRGILHLYPPQLVYAQTRSLVPGEGDTLPSFIPGVDKQPVPSDGYEVVRVMVFGSHYGVNYTIRWLYRLNFAQVSEWSFLMPAPNPGEVMSIVTKRIPLGRTS